jgi:hypothetical protein
MVRLPPHHVSQPDRPPTAPTVRTPHGAERAIAPALTALLALALPACSPSGRGTGPTQSGATGQLLSKPDGSAYIVDPHRGGGATRLGLAEVLWGRLVDVYDVDAAGNVGTAPVLRDFVIDENVQTNASGVRLETNPITETTRLILAWPRDTREFAALLVQASATLAPVLPNGGGSGLPFSYAPRNVCLVVRFDDLLDDSSRAELDLVQTVLVRNGYPATIPAQPRLRFDPNHGGVVSGRFHSTRVLLDLTVSEAEAGDMTVPQPIQPLGLSASLPGNPAPNAVLRLPTRLHFGVGQFVLLRNLAGATLSPVGNGPIDSASPTQDLVRYWRTGNDRDTNNGFLLDFNAPQVIGGWPVTLLASREDPAGLPGFDYLVDAQFPTSCQADARRGDIFEVGSALFEVSAGTTPPDLQGIVRDVRVHSLSVRPLARTPLGTGLFRTPLRYDTALIEDCWLRIQPDPLRFPVQDVSPSSQLSVSFSEPMDPRSFDLDTLQVVRGTRATPADPRNVVIGTIVPGLDLRDFTLTPLLPLAHVANAEVYTVHLRTERDGFPNRGATDLSGNTLALPFPATELTVDPGAPIERNGGIVLTFDSLDELDPQGALDFGGNLYLDASRAALVPRPIAHFSWPVDRSNPVPSLQVPFTPGVQTPLSPLGSRLQTVWRYCDLGWSVRDVTKYDLDVIGLAWAPVGGRVLADFFEEFEIRLAHSRFLPDEIRKVFGFPKWPSSGLGGSNVPFTGNVLDDPRSPQKVVHPRTLGYRIDPLDTFSAISGTVLLPWPMNRGSGPPTTYTWRDTTVLAKGGPLGGGVPLGVEVGAPLFLENSAGSFAEAFDVPSVALPLLMEFRCYPSSSGIGLNPLDINLAVNTAAQPNFRAFSTGGINSSGQRIPKDPDAEIFPSGGFNPGSRPPGRPTASAADNALYLGQLDVVLRISRGHSIWIDSLIASPRYSPPLVEPGPGELPTGTQVIVDYRGADDFVTSNPEAPFGSGALDAYGDLQNGSVSFHAGDAGWHASIAEIDGARYFQVRIGFVGNIDTLVAPHLATLAVAYEEP